MMTVDTEEIIRDVTDHITPTLHKKSVNFIIDLNEDAKSIWTDPEILRRILANLLENAVRFTDSDTDIRFLVEPSGKMIRFSVSDQGPGVPFQFQEKIFEKYQQLENPDSGFRNSAGIGLTFCKMAVEAMNGTIGVDSEFDTGSTFWFELPVGNSR
jgi:two-component system, sensor histidine kinase and response regulator